MHSMKTERDREREKRKRKIDFLDICNVFDWNVCHARKTTTTLSEQKRNIQRRSENETYKSKRSREE